MKNTKLLGVCALICIGMVTNSQAKESKRTPASGAGYFERAVKIKNRIVFCRISEDGVTLSARPDELGNSKIRYAVFTKKVTYDPETIEGMKDLFGALTATKKLVPLTNVSPGITNRFPKSDGNESYVLYTGLGPFGGGLELASNRYSGDIKTYFPSISSDDLETLVQFVDNVCDR